MTAKRKASNRKPKKAAPSRARVIAAKPVPELVFPPGTFRMPPRTRWQRFVDFFRRKA